jgi:acetyl-CoA C-acetyltransferase
VDDVVLGSSRPAAGNLARIAALRAGLGEAVPAVTVDRQCGGGLESLRLAAALIGNGDAEVVLAAGVDSASSADAGVTSGPSPQARFAPEGYPDPLMGRAADDLAAVRGISRERQDAYAARSYRSARLARDAGVFAEELTGVGAVTDDDTPREPSRRVLARLHPAFGPGSTVTAGNACGIADGAAALTVVSERFRAEHDLPGLRVLGTAVAGTDPALPGLGAVEATRAVLARTGVTLDRVAVLEVTEAFAAQVLALTDALGLPDPQMPDQVLAGRVLAGGELPGDSGRGPLICPDGGAIALGHPWGASGALLVVRLFSRLVRRAPGAAASGKPALGLATCAIAGGQGVAVLFERVG